MMYLSVNNTGFCFKDPNANEILPTDILVSHDIYDEFLKSQGSQLRVKNSNGQTFDEIFEEVEPPPDVYIPTESDKNLADLTFNLMMAGVI